MPAWTSEQNRLTHLAKHGPEFESEAEYDRLAQAGPADDAYPLNQRCNARGSCSTAYYSPSKLLLHVLRDNDRRVVTMYRKTAEAERVRVVVPAGRGSYMMEELLYPPYKGRLRFPGGKVEAGEDWHTAAAREILEETGQSMDPGKLEYLGQEAGEHFLLAPAGSLAAGRFEDKANPGKIIPIRPGRMTGRNYKGISREQLLRLLKQRKTAAEVRPWHKEIEQLPYNRTTGAALSFLSNAHSSQMYRPRAMREPVEMAPDPMALVTGRATGRYGPDLNRQIGRTYTPRNPNLPAPMFERALLNFDHRFSRVRPDTPKQFPGVELTDDLGDTGEHFDLVSQRVKLSPKSNSLALIHELAHAADPVLRRLKDKDARLHAYDYLSSLESEIPAMVAENAWAMRTGKASAEDLNQADAERGMTPGGRGWVYEHMRRFGPQFTERTDDVATPDDQKELYRFMGDLRGDGRLNRLYRQYLSSGHPTQPDDVRLRENRLALALAQHHGLSPQQMQQLYEGLWPDAEPDMDEQLFRQRQRVEDERRWFGDRAGPGQNRLQSGTARGR